MRKSGQVYYTKNYKKNGFYEYRLPASTGRANAAVTAGLPISWCFVIESFDDFLFFLSQDVVVIVEFLD